jgi:serine/threonine-protein kinase RsbT
LLPVGEQKKDEDVIKLEFELRGLDFIKAGEASSELKQRLKKLGFNPGVVRRAAIAAYEAEMNVIIHAYKGVMEAEIFPNRIVIRLVDQGPGISDLDLAMQEGYSTASDEIREMGFGAGMGLPNIRRCADEFKMESELKKGTYLEVVIYADKG